MLSLQIFKLYIYIVIYLCCFINIYYFTPSFIPTKKTTASTIPKVHHVDHYEHFLFLQVKPYYKDLMLRYTIIIVFYVYNIILLFFQFIYKKNVYALFFLFSFIFYYLFLFLSFSLHNSLHSCIFIFWNNPNPSFIVYEMCF